MNLIINCPKENFAIWFKAKKMCIKLNQQPEIKIYYIYLIKVTELHIVKRFFCKSFIFSGI